MKKDYRIGFNLFYIVTSIALWIMTMRVITAKFGWHEWSVKDLFTYHGEYMSLLGDITFLIFLILIVVLVDWYIMNKHINRMEKMVNLLIEKVNTLEK